MQKTLPSRVYVKHGAYYYDVPESDRHLWDGKSWYRLGSDYQKAIAHFKERSIRSAMTETSLGYLINEWVDAHVMNSNKIRPATRRSYLAALKHLTPVFEFVDVKNISRKYIRQYFDMRKKASHTSAHREIEVLRTFLNWCVDMEYVDFNPANKLRFHKPAPRERYVTDDEVEFFLRTAGPLLNLYVPLKIYTGARKNDLLSITRNDWLPDGLFVGDRKSFRVNTGRKSRGRIFARTPQLENIMEKILDQAGDVFLFCTKNNQPYINFDEDTTTAFDSIWQRAKQRAIKAGLPEPFQERDLRAKTATDAETLEEARAVLGHSSTLMTRTVYRRKPEIVKKIA